MITPVRRQYLQIKRRFPDSLLLFRMGDFYETFDDDAITLARDLDIALTSRAFGKSEKHPLAGIPYHSLNNYLGRLIKAGHKVAICEQTSDPATSKGLVERKVVRVVTPGTVLEPFLLNDRTNNYLASAIIDDSQAALAYADISTSGTIFVSQMSVEGLLLELARLMPAELLIPEEFDLPLPDYLRIEHLPTEAFAPDKSEATLKNVLQVATLDGFGFNEFQLGLRATGALLNFLESSQADVLNNVNKVRFYDSQGHMALDQHTIRNLGIFSGGRSESEKHSLVNVIDLTETPMGGRLIRQWLGQPLVEVDGINIRLESTAWFYDNEGKTRLIREKLGKISDVERLVSRAKNGTAIPREIVALGRSLEVIPSLLTILSTDNNISIKSLVEKIPDCNQTAAIIRHGIEQEPGQIGDGTVIKRGYSTELDDLRSSSASSRNYISKLEAEERGKTDIKNLKVGYNKVFGYYIEVTNPNLSKVPTEYQRRQTLTSGERFITPELKEQEDIILKVAERILEIESGIYRELCLKISEASEALLEAARWIGHLDVFASFANVARRFDYVRPIVNESKDIQIIDGRHPILEQIVEPGSFVPNDTFLSTEDGNLVILTGPNMSGKSTYLRQVALIVLMAQIGSFVPAGSAEIGLVDRIFTRVGLQDDLASGQSTFMVEMVETANILNNATDRSLIILDEIGRGTSTYDGLSIAQAVAEHIHNQDSLQCRTLFATHYQELTELSETLNHARNHSVSVSEEGETITFLHRIVPGKAGRSYGIHVAKLAGIPKEVILRASHVLESLETNKSSVLPQNGKNETDVQLGMFQKPPEVVRLLTELDLPNLTPLEAINTLHALQQKAKADSN